jgi:hypothetical protein
VATQPYAAVSLVANAHTLQQQHYLLIDLCVGMYVYVCMCMYICVCVCVCIYIYIYIYIDGCVCTHTHAHTCTHSLRPNPCIQALHIIASYLHAYTRTHTYAHSHIYKHKYIHTHIHTHSLGFIPSRPNLRIQALHTTASYLQTYIHTYIHTHSLGFTPSRPNLRIQALHTTAAVFGGADPTWNETCELREAYADISAVEKLAANPQNIGASDFEALKGEPVLMMVSVHDMGDGMGDDMCGRVVIPHIEAGKPVDQWLMLQVCMYVCMYVCM